MLTLSRSPHGHDLYTHCCTLAIDASCQVSLKSVHRLRRRRVFKGFYHILALIGQVVLEMFEYYGDIRVYCPG